jgi:hypothetical protein
MLPSFLPAFAESPLQRSSGLSVENYEGFDDSAFLDLHHTKRLLDRIEL